MKPHPVWNAFSHTTIIGSAMFIIFLCIDRVNPAMDFLRSNLSKWCLLAYCLTSLITALCSAIYLFERRKAVMKHHPAHRQTEEEPVPAAPKQETQRPLNCGGAAESRVSVGNPGNAYYLRGREPLCDTRYDRERFNRRKQLSYTPAPRSF